MPKADLRTKVKDYAKIKGKITIPEIQVEFNLDYKAASAIVHHLCDEKFMWLYEGLIYKVYDSSYTWKERQARYNESYDALKVYDSFLPRDKSADSSAYDEEERFMLKALSYCIIHKEVYLRDIKNALSCSYIKAYKAVDWMLYNDYVRAEDTDGRNCYMAIMTKQKFAKKFGIRTIDALNENYPDNDVFAGKRRQDRNIDRHSVDSDYKNCEEYLKKLIYKLSSSEMTDNHSESLSKKYYSMFTSGFNMKEAVSDVPDLETKVSDVISAARTEVTIFGQEWGDGKRFESLCLEVIVNIVGMNRSWKRMDAVKEAAREVVAVKYTGQSQSVCNVHSRVLYELLDGEDDDYEQLKKMIWNQ